MLLMITSSEPKRLQDKSTLYANVDNFHLVNLLRAFAVMTRLKLYSKRMTLS